MTLFDILFAISALAPIGVGWFEGLRIGLGCAILGALLGSVVGIGPALTVRRIFVALLQKAEKGKKPVNTVIVISFYAVFLALGFASSFLVQFCEKIAAPLWH